MKNLDAATAGANLERGGIVVRRFFTVFVVVCVVIPLWGDVALPASERAKHRDMSPLSAADRPASVTQILRGVHDHSDRGAWLNAIARVVEQQSGSDVLTAPAGAGTDDANANADVPSAESGSRARAVPAGDLDGDGREDSLIYKRHLGGDLVLQARSGSDGSLLWRRSGGATDGLILLAKRDLTGDAADDSVEVRLKILTEKKQCLDCLKGSYSATFRWIVGVTSGADGTRAWTRRYNGNLAESWDDTINPSVVWSYRSAYAIRGTNIDIAPFITTRHGAAKREVLLNAWDAEYQWHSNETWAGTQVAHADRYTYDYTLRAKTKAQLIAATDGRLVRTLRENSAGTLALLYPLPGRSGRDNLVWERAILPDSSGDCVAVYHQQSTQHCLDDPEPESLEVALLDGRSLRQRWTRSFALDSEAYDWQSVPSHGDFDADRRPDLEIVIERDWFEFETTYLSAARGRKLWGAAGFPVAAGPMDRKRGDDVLNMIDVENDSGTVETLTLERRNGLTGGVVGTRRWRVRTTRSDETSTTSTWLHVSAGGDVNGDRSLDYAVSLLQWRETYGKNGRPVDRPLGSRSNVFSGADGESLYRINSPKVISLDVGTDFDGDAVAEVTRTTYHARREQASQTFAPLRLRDHQRLWVATAKGTSPYWDGVYFAVSGNADGVPGADVMLHVETIDDRGRLSTTLTSLAGTTGVARWSVRPARR